VLKFDTNTNFLAPALSIFTPAIGQIFFSRNAILHFASSASFRCHLIAFSGKRKSRLRSLRIFNDIECKPSCYIGILTAINIAISLLTLTAAVLIGLPNPVTLGVLAFMLNYISLIGHAIMAIVLFAVGLIAVASLGYALIAPDIFITNRPSRTNS